MKMEKRLFPSNEHRSEQLSDLSGGDTTDREKKKKHKCYLNTESLPSPCLAFRLKFDYLFDITHIH